MRTGRLLLAGLAFLVVGGCSEPDVVADPPPLATPTAGSASSTTPSASPTATSPSQTTTVPTGSSSIPAAARAHTNAGAEAFARYYLAQVNLAWTGPDPSKLNGLASPSCKSCAKLAETANSLAASQRRYNAEPLSLGPSILLPESRPDDVRYDIVFIQEPRQIMDSSQNVSESIERQAILSEFSMAWVRGSWQMREIKVVNPS